MKKLFAMAIVVSFALLPLGRISAAFVMAPPTLERFDAKSALLVDEETGEVLVGRAIDTVYPLASLTKLMAAAVLLSYNVDWTSNARVDSADYAQDAIVRIGEQYSLQSLFQASLIGSSNTAMNALVRTVGVERGAFVKAMNETAQRWGMNATHFVEPTGLDADNVSTARDIAQMMRITMAYPAIRTTVQQPSTLIESVSRQGKRFKRIVTNTNWLLRPSARRQPYAIIGGKTGHIEEAGYNLAVLATSINRRTVLAIVLGTTNHFARFEEVDQLLQWAAKALKPLSRVI